MKTLYLSAEELNMLDALRRKSEETYFHSRNVSKLAVALGISCRLSWEAIQILRMGGLLHDVGKLKVPSAILNKKGSLNADEMREMRRHSAYGEMLLRGTAGVRDESVLNIVRHHHEKIGGKGYPDGFPENHLLVQIVTVADIYDALRSDRCYRKVYDREKVFAILYADNGINRRIVDRLYTVSGPTLRNASGFD